MEAGGTMSGAQPEQRALDAFLSRHRASLLVLSGAAAGTEFILDQRAIRLGRGPGVDLAIDHPSLEIQHARLEFRAGSYWLCNEAREATTRLNGSETSQQELKPDDRIQLGEIALEFTIEQRLALATSSLPPFP
jgi:predicted component of type VI protein secretion system